jgi:hypothetical protein
MEVMGLIKRPTSNVGRPSFAIRNQVGKAFVYFKHEESGIGRKLAQQMVKLLA